jgi:hypothetical protein
MAWVRALRCNTVYITRYRSMRVPVSIRTSYFMADNVTITRRKTLDSAVMTTRAEMYH